MNYPGFVSEARSLLELYKLPNIIDGKTMTKQKWKTKVKSEIKTFYEKNSRKRCVPPN